MTPIRGRRKQLTELKTLFSVVYTALFVAQLRQPIPYLLLFRKDHTHEEKEKTIEELVREITALWQTDELRRKKPSALDGDCQLKQSPTCPMCCFIHPTCPICCTARCDIARPPAWHTQDLLSCQTCSCLLCRGVRTAAHCRTVPLGSHSCLSSQAHPLDRTFCSCMCSACQSLQRRVVGCTLWGSLCGHPSLSALVSLTPQNKVRLTSAG